MDDIPSTAEPVEAWRAWQLALDRSGPSLIPIGKGRAWPRRSAAAARCWKQRSHQAPAIACTCGLYATRDATLLRHARSPAVVGTVALWGRVVEHALGWRGELAYPQRLALACHVCLFQRGVACAQPSVVVAHRGGALVPVCDDHLRVTFECGSDRCEVLPAEGILSELVEGYAIDPLVLPTVLSGQARREDLPVNAADCDGSRASHPS